MSSSRKSTLITQFLDSTPSFFSLSVSFAQSLSALRLGVPGGRKETCPSQYPQQPSPAQRMGSPDAPASLAVPTAFGSPGKSEWPYCLPYSCLLLPHPSIKAGNLPPPHSGLGPGCQPSLMGPSLGFPTHLFEICLVSALLLQGCQVLTQVKQLHPTGLEITPFSLETLQTPNALRTPSLHHFSSLPALQVAKHQSHHPQPRLLSSRALLCAFPWC